MTDSDLPFKPKSTAVVTRYLYRVFANAGLDSDLILERCGIDLSLIEDSEYRVSHEKLLHMWEVVGELSNDPDFSLHLATEGPTAPFNAAGFSVMTSKNLREMLSSLEKYVVVFSDNGRFKTIEDTETAKVVIDLSSGWPASRQHTDFWLVFFWRNLSSNVGWTLPLLEVGFRHDQPADTSVYEAVFGCDLKFNQEENYFSFPRVYLDYQSISADPAMHKVHESQALKQLHALTESGILNKVKKAVFQSLPAKDIELKDIAELLNLTPRTVQRNLSREGSTFKKLVDEARKDYTLAEIRDTSFAISEIAYRLGYKDLSSFYRAFKRWTGTTPNIYREQSRQDS